MRQRRLGRTDLSIAPVVFGGNVFGWTADKRTSFALLDRFAKAGFNAIDTADVYSAKAPGNKGGESERACRRRDALEKRRAMMMAWAQYLGHNSTGQAVEYGRSSDS